MLLRRTVEEALQFVEENDVKFIRLTFCDIFGRQKNICIMPNELPKAFRDGIPFEASAVKGFMSEEAGQESSAELLLFPDPTTLAFLPWRPATGRVVRVFCDICHPDGQPFLGDGRFMLRQAVRRLERANLSCRLGTECEFYLLELNEDGSVKEGEDAIQVVSGIVAPMYFQDKEEAAKFEGKKVGDKVVFNPRKASGDNITELSSMLNIDKERTAAVNGDFEMVISEIIVVRPAELGEEFYTQVFGKDKVHNEEEYLAAVKDMIAQGLSGNSEMIFRLCARKELMAKYGNMELPEVILKKWLISRNDEKLNEENIDDEFSKMRPDLEWQLIKEDVARELGVKIEESDLKSFAKATAARQFAQYGMTNMADDVIEKYAENLLEDKNYRGRLIEEVGDIKLFGAIQNAITLDKQQVSIDEFKEIASKL